MFRHYIDDDLFLQPWDVQHAEELYALVDQNREHLRAWLPWVDGTKSAEDSGTFIKAQMKGRGERTDLAMGIYWHDALVGAIGAHRISWNHYRCEIGYWLSGHATGNGIMTRANRAFIDFLVNEWNMNRIEIRVDPRNIKSAAIPLRLGFTTEGTLRQCHRQYDEYIDLTIYSMLSEEWGKSSP